jgi:hypothetical protein
MKIARQMTLEHLLERGFERLDGQRIAVLQIRGDEILTFSACVVLETPQRAAWKRPDTAK